MRKAKRNIPMLAALVLLLLTMVSTYFTAGLYARYTAYASGKDSARVASFQIETDLDRVTLGVAQDETPAFELGGTEGVTSIRIPFYIENRSEVAVTYSVDVDFGTQLPEYLSLTLSDGTNEETLTPDGSTAAFQFEDFGTMTQGAVTAQRAELTLTISVEDEDLSRITAEISIPATALTVGVYQTN